MSKTTCGLGLKDCSQRKKWGRWLGAALVPALLGTALLVPRRESNQDGLPAAGLGDPEILSAAYQDWQANYAAYAQDADVLVLGLHYVKGLSTHHSTAAGSLHLDLETGSLDATVQGLPGAASYELWIVDNLAANDRSDEHSSVRPEPDHDDVRWVGALESTGGDARIATTLDIESLADFDLDMVVISPAGTDVREGLVFGTPSLFQRVYHEERSAGFGPRADGADGRRTEIEPTLALAAILSPAMAAASAVPQTLIGEGELLFFEAQFNGNGRTCGTCHPANNNLTIDPEFIGSLDALDPLFVAEFNPALSSLENPRLMRNLGVILENLDGFDKPGVMRGVPHVFALARSMNPAVGGFDGSPVAPLQRTGWGGDGSPGTGTLREFAIGAVTQHFTRTLNRVAGVDFRLPTEHELDALEAFQLSLGRQEDPDLTALTMKNPIAERGRQLYLKESTQNGLESAGKCNSCHHNGGANASPLLLSANGFPAGEFNLNLNVRTSVLDAESLAQMIDPANVPVDGGFGKDPNIPFGGFGSHAFNVPSLIEAPDTAPYFHDNSALTLEAAIAFYIGGEFNVSPASNLLATIDNPPGFGVMQMSHPDMQAIAAFLRVANSALNVRSAKTLMQRLKTTIVQFDDLTRERVFETALSELDDARSVLKCAHIHPDAIAKLDQAWELLNSSHGTVLSKIDQSINIARGVPLMLIE